MSAPSFRWNQLERTSVMGVLNVTPDSFSDGGNLFSNQQVNLDLTLRRARQMYDEGVDIIDVGGESTRPGAEPISVQQELERVVPVVEALSKEFNVPISVDTSTADVIKESVAAGAVIINDVRSLQREGALEAVAKTDAAVCLMHMSGEPNHMQNNPQYVDVVDEVRTFLLNRAGNCEAAGISSDRIALDPGFGFGKNLQHNIDLFKGLSELSSMEYPLLIGVSRKAMVGSILDKPVDGRMVGSVALALLAVQSGVKVIRAHDIAATQDALKVFMALG